MISNNADQLMKDAAVALAKQRQVILSLEQKLRELETPVRRNRGWTTTAPSESELMKRVDSLLAGGSPKSLPVQEAGSGGQFFTRHGGNVLPVLGR
jgi:hypothetical protein